MPLIVRHTNRVLAARTFIDEVLDKSGETLYIGLGRPASNPWSNEAAPPTPTNTKDEDNAFWADLVGIGKVSQANATMHGKPRLPWTQGIVYLPLSDSTDKSNVASGSQFYVIASNNVVYTCVSNNGGAVTGAFEPSHGAGDVDPGDGYVWRFQYDAGALAGWSVLETLNWMPVPDDGTDSSIALILGANYVMAGLQFPDYAGTGNVIPNSEYRQIALLRNPKLSGGGAATAQWYAPASLENVGGDVSDNIVLTLDNRVKITRAVGQSETAVAVLAF